MMKDEGPFVLEWVAHHLAVGFTDLVVYTNDCSDGTDDMLIRLEALGLCHHRRNVIPEGLRPQPSALNHAQEEPVVQQSDWVMVFDADEFLSIRYGDGTLDDLLGAVKAQGANGIVVTWRIFGSGGVVDWSRAPVTEQYLMAAPTDWNKGWGVKTLFTYSAEHWKLGIHRPKMKTKWHKTDFPDQVKWLNGSGREMEDYFKFRGWRSITRTVGYDWVQLNHYAVKSVDSYAIRKMRGNVNFKKDKYNSDYWSLQDRNEVRDDTMLRYSARRAAIMAALLDDPVLNRLHLAALERAETRLAEIRGTEAYRTLVDDLARASLVPISEIVAKPPQPRDKEKIASLMGEVEKARAARDKAARKAAAPPQAGLFLPGPLPEEGNPGAETHANQTMRLPADDRLFAPAALTAIRAGKFQRGLARKLPALMPKGAKVLELSAAPGFLAGHCANLRPDLTLVLQEDDPALRALILRVAALSGRPMTDRFRLSPVTLGHEVASAAQALVRAEAPDVLILADPRVDPDMASGLVEGRAPALLLCHGGWLERWKVRADQMAGALADLGLYPIAGLDPRIALGFGRQAGRAG